MDTRQKILKALYPVVMFMSKLTGKNFKTMDNTENSVSGTSIYSLSVHLNNGSDLRLETLQGKKILLVNTASNCGYTGQYDELQKLYERFKDKLEIIAFPANDFKEQEKGSDEEIAEFCKVNYGVTFPLAKKSTVVRTGQQNEIFKWLSTPALNGWNEQEPTWNFSKYLIDEKGILVKYFDPGVSPLASEVVAAVTETGSGR
ncbi:MAG: glutathione peroxidase [Chitinophagaceae bacterium]|nr:MAG: glutathione peroxidase [Chitinophagaceae bacterium]